MGKRLVNANVYHTPKIGARQNIFNFTIEKNPGFLRWGVERGMLLGYLATIGRDQINKRTATERDVDGEYFARYQNHRSAQRDPGSKQIVRDAKGQWTWIIDRGEDDPVYLRSNYDVQDRQRMTKNLKVSPKKPKFDALVIFIKPSGGRGGVGHPLRAFTCHYGKSRGNQFEAREWIGLSRYDWEFILTNIRKDHVLAFVERTKAKWRAMQEATRDRNLKRARRKAKRQLKLSERARKRAEGGADAQHKRHLSYLKRMGVVQEDGESLQDAIKRASGERRAQRAQRRRKRQGRKSWTRPLWKLTAAQTEEVYGRRLSRYKRTKPGASGYKI